MKSYKLYIHILLIAVISTAAASCDLFELRDRTIDGVDPQVELFPLNQTVNGDGTLNINAQLIGEQRDADLPLTVAVVDSLSSAVEGTHYSLPTNSVTISANSSTAPVPVDIMASNVTDGVVVLVLELTGTDEVFAAPNLRRSTITIQAPPMQ